MYSLRNKKKYHFISLLPLLTYSTVRCTFGTNLPVCLVVAHSFPFFHHFYMVRPSHPRQYWLQPKFSIKA